MCLFTVTVMRGGHKTCTQGFCWETLMEGDRVKELGVDKRIILKWIMKRLNGESWTGLIWFTRGTGSGCL
jgi:hypothetical protein